MEMAKEDLRGLIYKHVSKIAKVPEEEIKGEDNLRDDLGLDSLRSMELLARISDELDVDIEFEALQGVETVDDIIAFAEKL
jgi:acyl carrier protein